MSDEKRDYIVIKEDPGGMFRDALERSEAAMGIHYDFDEVWDYIANTMGVAENDMVLVGRVDPEKGSVYDVTLGCEDPRRTEDTFGQLVGIKDILKDKQGKGLR